MQYNHSNMQTVQLNPASASRISPNRINQPLQSAPYIQNYPQGYPTNYIPQNHSRVHVASPRKQIVLEGKSRSISPGVQRIPVQIGAQQRTLISGTQGVPMHVIRNEGRPVTAGGSRLIPPPPRPHYHQRRLPVYNEPQYRYVQNRVHHPVQQIPVSYLPYSPQPYSLPQPYMVRPLEFIKQHPQHNLNPNFDYQSANLLCESKIVQTSIYCVICESQYKASQKEEHVKRHIRSGNNRPLVDKEIKSRIQEYQHNLNNSKPILRPIVAPETHQLTHTPTNYELVAETVYDDHQQYPKVECGVGEQPIIPKKDFMFDQFRNAPRQNQIIQKHPQQNHHQQSIAHNNENVRPSSEVADHSLARNEISQRQNKSNRPNNSRQNESDRPNNSRQYHSIQSKNNLHSANNPKEANNLIGHPSNIDSNITENINLKQSAPPSDISMNNILNQVNANNSIHNEHHRIPSQAEW